MRLLKFLAIAALVLSSEAKPKRYHGITEKVIKTPTAETREVSRLSTDVLPSHYDIHLTLTEANLKAGKFSGVEDITISVNKDVKSFNIHARDLTIAANTITLKPTDDTLADPCTTVVAGDEAPDTHFVAITCDATIPKGAYVLHLEYDGVLSTTEMSGFYQSTYYNEQGELEYLATTQFEETGARRAFPSFDEPAIKATFQITITYPNGYSALSNTLPGPPTVEGDHSTVVFSETPLMSTYLIAFIVSKFDCSPLATSEFLMEVCSRVETKDTRQLALDTAPKSLQHMQEYTQLDYKNMGLGKLSQAAIPDFSAGAMENWGMVTYREADLLYDAAQSSNSYKQGVVSVITHELSHQWFGDYVTLDWWSDVFLNEGFATYFEYHASDLIEPDWEFTKQFVIEEVQTVLLTDSTGTTQPLHYVPLDASEISNRFDDISYNKGGTILRMIHHFLTLDTFKAGLTSYLSKDRVGQPENLWKSFQEVKPDDLELPKEVGEIMDSWVNKAGYPIITVKLADDGKSVTLSQGQFLLSGTGNTKWYVPITYSTSKDNDFQNTATKLWLTPDKDETVDLDGDWIILNNQQVGYYRVNYDDTLFDKITAALKNKLDDIDEISRSQIVDDQLNLARAGKKSYGTVLEFLGQVLKQEKSYYVWYPTFTGFNYLLQKTGNKQVRDALNNLIKELIDTYAKSLPMTTEDPSKQVQTLSQVQALTWACKVNYNTCVKDATDKFEDYKKDDNAQPSGNLKGLVYCNALRNSAQSEDDYNFLWGKYTSTSLATEKVEILRALGCVKDSAQRKKYLAEALGENVRLQDARYVFSSVYSSNPEGIDDVLDFIATNATDFNTRFDDDDSTVISLIYSVANLITSQAQIDKLQKIADSDVGGSIKTAANTAVDNANKNLEVVTDLEKTLRDYFKLDATPSSAVINSFHFINIALLLVVCIWFSY